MFIRRTQIKSRQHGEPYYTYRLVESERVQGRMKQRILLNLGRHFEVPKSDWRALSSRIEQLLEGQSSLLSIELSPELESLAQRYAAQILASRCEETTDSATCQSGVLDTLELVRPRRVGIEQLAWHAMTQLGLPDKLVELGFNRHQLAAAIGSIVARLAFPASELASHAWLQQRSGLGELLGYDFESMGLDRLYQAPDQLWKHKAALEQHLFGSECELFACAETITLYDLTNTFFEGDVKGAPKAQRGHSKEKRSDRPLITLGLVLDGSGFPRTSEFFPGNVSEPATLEAMLRRLHSQKGSTVVMDAGLASEDNITWLVAQGYRYLVVSRQRKREFDAAQAVTVKETGAQRIQIQRVINSTSGEIELYCHSQAREQKEQAIQDRFQERFEAALQSLHEGLAKKGTTKRYDKILERIGRLKEKYRRAAQHYTIRVEQDPASAKATAIHWERQAKANSQATHPGVYCLRTNLADWDEATLWQTYTMLTDLEAVFRCLKSELGLRPNYHQKPERIESHLFITLLAYHVVHTLRTQLKSRGIHDSWQTLRHTMENQQRITVRLKREDGKTLHVRKATRAEPHQKVIYDALGIAPQPGPEQRTLV
ncbi:MAG: IS1634 family transposase [Gammaproteobacteria bacterium]|nr:IS1634 family transposase [Gammaproteobacteria bacterium]